MNSISKTKSKVLSPSVRRHLADYGFTVAFVILVIVAASLTDVFFTQENLTNLSRKIVTNGMLSLGMLIVILTGGIDLSVGPIVALGSILAAGLQSDMHFGFAVVLALFGGVACGGLNGVLIARFKLQPFIVTLATMGSISGLVFLYSESPQYSRDMNFMMLMGGSIGPFPVAALTLFSCIPLVWFFLNRTTSGRAIVAIGGNSEAVRLAGVNVKKHIITAYALSGFFAALAGVLIAAKLGISQPSLGKGYELDAIAAVVIGGGILGGGGGTVLGMCGGVLALGVIDNVLNLFGVSTYYQQVLKGAIILLAVLARRKENGA